MKKLSLMTAMILMVGMAGFAQVFEKGNQGINAGIGIGPGWNGTANYGFGFGINASYEYAVAEIPMGSTLTGVIGVGGMAGVSFSTRTEGATGDYSAIDYFIAARGNYHFIFHDKLDPYAGIALGYQGSSYNWKGDGPDPKDDLPNNLFRVGVLVGAKYYFSDNFGVYAELGYLLNLLNIGVTFKID